MKIEYLTFFLIVPVLCLAEWRTIHPDPAPYEFHNLYFINEKLGWLVGDAGAIYKITNGTDWTQLTAPTQEDLDAVFFHDELNGWVAGGSNYEGELYRTSDGGETWQKVQTPNTNRLHSLTFVNDQLGFAGGRFGEILRTTDGGLTWEMQRLGRFVIHQISFYTENTGWAATGSGVFKTLNGGVSWNRLFKSGDSIDIRALYVFSRATLIVGGESKAVQKSVDGGDRWTSYALPYGQKVYGMTFFDNKVGVAVSYDGTISRTVDGGESWEVSHPLLDCIHVFGVNGRTAYACGRGGKVFATHDKGVTWTSKSKGFSADLSAVQFNESIGWAVGSNGTILHSSDAGETWNVQSAVTSHDLIDADIQSSNKWVVGSHGIVLHSTDGYEWRKQQIGDARLNAVTAPTFDSIWTCAEDGTIWFSNSAGDHWEKQFTIPNIELCDIQFVDELYGWCAGGSPDSSILLFTNDAGQSWRAISHPLPFGIRELHFLDRQNGWAIGGNIWTREYNIIKTVDGGQTWYFPSDKYLMAGSRLYFCDPLHGWVFFYQTIRSTLDGGRTWDEFEFDTRSQINDVYFQEPNVGWAVGADGLILKFQGQNLQANSSTSPIHIFPNPANSRTNITVLALSDDYASVSICNSRGQRVLSLYDGLLPAGEHIFYFDAQEYASGMYWVMMKMKNTVRAESFTIVR